VEAADSTAGVPLFVVRLRDLERIAWRDGRAAARVAERRSIRAFVEAASRALRAADVIAHDRENANFLAALLSPTRSPGHAATAADCRATLARLGSRMELLAGMRLETGWRLVRGSADRTELAAAIEGALERGKRERERLAFFSTVGHELRTPLTSIQGYLETLIDGELDPATARRFLEVARREALRLGRLVDGMLDLSLLDVHDGPQPCESSFLSDVCDAALDAVTPLALARRVMIVQSPYVDALVALGADRLTQVLVNLLENAVKHGLERGLIRLSVEPLGTRYVEIRVDDDGPGVAPEERESIFTLASRGANASAKGSGLGLAVVRGILERVGGEVDVGASELGGAQFRARVPLMTDA